MTRNTNARVAGATFLLYIIIGVAQMFVAKGVTTGSTMSDKFASIARHAPQVQTNVILSLVVCFTALTLAVALYGITRDEDRELALLAFTCRIGEGMIGAVSAIASLILLALATAQTTAPNAGGEALGASLMKLRGMIPVISATFFAVGSAVFCWLLLRGRMIPTVLAWLGVAASVLLVVLLPLQLVGRVGGAVVQWMWLPMAAFEIPLAIWLLVKGVRAPQHG